MEMNEQAEFEKRVGITGVVANFSNKTGLIGHFVGEGPREIEDSFAKFLLFPNHVVLKAIGGPYKFPYTSVTLLRKKWWWWEIKWQADESIGNIKMSAFHMQAFIDQLNKRLSQ